MKKSICILFTILFFSVFSFAEENFLSFSLGLSSGIPFYGNKEMETVTSTVSANRIDVGLCSAININAVKEVTFFAGADALCDLNWSGNNFCHHLHTDFSGGIKIYPGLLGLNFGLAYLLGFRTDFDNISGKALNAVSTSWGNGAKVSLEYNFAHDGFTNYLPSVGVFWKFIPRGSNFYDNLICAYMNFNF